MGIKQEEKVLGRKMNMEMQYRSSGEDQPTMQLDPVIGGKKNVE